MVHFVTEQKTPGEALSEAELRANLPLITLARSESIGTPLSGLMALLLGAPHVLRKLQDEVRSTFQNRSDINMTAMEQMKVLNACINETLRIYPPGSAGFPRVAPQFPDNGFRVEFECIITLCWLHFAPRQTSIIQTHSSPSGGMKRRPMTCPRITRKHGNRSPSVPEIVSVNSKSTHLTLNFRSVCCNLCC